MSELKLFVDQYLALWHEEDAELRRQRIADLWIEEGVQFTRRNEYHGYRELEARVSAAHEQFVKTDNCIFKLASAIDAHHNVVRFSWEMVPATGGDVAGSGTIFLILAEDGRIRFDYQF